MRQRTRDPLPCRPVRSARRRTREGQRPWRWAVLRDSDGWPPTSRRWPSPSWSGPIATIAARRVARPVPVRRRGQPRMGPTRPPGERARGHCNAGCSGPDVIAWLTGDELARPGRAFPPRRNEWPRPRPVGPSEGPEAVRGRFWTFSGESGPDHENRGRRIAQDRRRGPLDGVRGPPDSCPARANTVATSSTGCAMASSTGAPSRRTTISTRRPFIDPPMARPLTYPLNRHISQSISDS